MCGLGSVCTEGCCPCPGSRPALLPVWPRIQLFSLLALLSGHQVSLKSLAGEKEMEKPRQRGQGEPQGVQRCPWSWQGHALAHTQLGAGPQTAAWGSSGCSSTPGVCTPCCTLAPTGCLNPGRKDGCSPGSEVRGQAAAGHNGVPPRQGVAGLCGFSATLGALRGQLQLWGWVFFPPQPCPPFPVIFSHSLSAFLPLHD